MRMKFDAVIFLIKQEEGQDELGNSKPAKTRRKVYANPFSIGRSEFYNASQQGLKPELAFQINTAEYKGEQKVEFQGQQYDVYRDNSVGDRTTIYLKARIANGRN